MIVLIVMGFVLSGLFYYFSNQEGAFRYGHIAVLVIYIGFIFVVVSNYAKLMEIRPKQYQKVLKDNKPCGIDIICSRMGCLEHIENTKDIMYIDYMSDNALCSTYDRIKQEPDTEKDTGSCYRNVKDQLTDEKVQKDPTSIRYFQLYMRDFFVKSAFNCCASGNFRNDYVNIESMNLAIRLGCRFLDFEVYTIDGTPCIATSTNRENFNYKESFNHLELGSVLSNVQKNAMTSRGCKNYTDPLILHFRVKTMISDSYTKLAKYIDKYFGSSVINSDYVIDFTSDQSPFSLPIEACIGRVFIVIHNYGGNAHFSSNSSFHNHMLDSMGKNAKLMKKVLTTWSGEQDNTNAPQYFSREYLNIVKDVSEDISDLKVAGMTKSSVGNSTELKKMKMIWPVPIDEDGVMQDSYEIVNDNLHKAKYFSVADSPSTSNNLIRKDKFAQIVPICIQAFQNCESSSNLNRGIMGEWLKFFMSYKHSKYDELVKSDKTMVATGMRQRILKYNMMVSVSSVQIPDVMNNVPKDISEEIKSMYEKE